jgi:ribosomal protein S18 acetylase RimI-like enzyme
MVKRIKEGGEAKGTETIRLAVKDDVRFVGELSGEVFSTFGDYAEIIPQWFLNSDVITIIYVKNTHPLGFAMLSALTGEILAIAVIPKYQRSGIGSALLGRIEDFANKLGLDGLSLHTAKENGVAHSFFQKAGFKVLGSQDKYYPKGQTALVMSKDIFNHTI